MWGPHQSPFILAWINSINFIIRNYGIKFSFILKHFRKQKNCENCMPKGNMATKIYWKKRLWNLRGSKDEGGELKFIWKSKFEELFTKWKLKNYFWGMRVWEIIFFLNRWKEELRRTHGQSSMPEGGHTIHALEVWLDARIVTESGHDAMSLACPLDPIFNCYWLGMPSIEILTHNQPTYSHPSFHNKNSKLYGKLSEQHVIQEAWIVVTLLWISVASFLILLPF